MYVHTSYVCMYLYSVGSTQIHTYLVSSYLHILCFQGPHSRRMTLPLTTTLPWWDHIRERETGSTTQNYLAYKDKNFCTYVYVCVCVTV